MAVTGENSQLDKTAAAEKWIARFPMWDWVGGRTSETSAVGLLPAALQGIDIKNFSQGPRPATKSLESTTSKPIPPRSLR